MSINGFLEEYTEIACINDDSEMYAQLRKLIKKAYINFPEAHFLVICREIEEIIDAPIIRHFPYHPERAAYMLKRYRESNVYLPHNIKSIQEFKEYKPTDKETKTYLINLLTNYKPGSQEWLDMIKWEEDLPELDFDEEVVEEFW